MVVGEAIFSQGRTKIKCERSYGANSSDESGSFSEGDSESGPAREPGPEVSIIYLSILHIEIVICTIHNGVCQQLKLL